MLHALLIAALLVVKPTCTEAFGDMNICYVLDGILILYGIILTVLYCRLRMVPSNKTPANLPEKQPAAGGIYAVRPLILMIKKTLKKAHEGKVTA
ncbi:Fc receptor, IgE, high affinity I, gamma polypeptide like isoform X1 [Anoplopoma fimbria]|uniref:Fc receptor, IgE, high affinity I, gamma polypeptide like isoform X1 n=1 Tax=Anoplopoma fimbria TaxID=229290 RepID=UPI0023EB3185|nr:Fc receptor, IgE, high affinity I, gamma polypeptide like isoform X1 [Anoplopoma fimbria]